MKEVFALLDAEKKEPSDIYVKTGGGSLSRLQHQKSVTWEEKIRIFAKKNAGAFRTKCTKDGQCKIGCRRNQE